MRDIAQKEVCRSGAVDRMTGRLNQCDQRPFPVLALMGPGLDPTSDLRRHGTTGMRRENDQVGPACRGDGGGGDPGVTQVIEFAPAKLQVDILPEVLHQLVAKQHRPIAGRLVFIGDNHRAGVGRIRTALSDLGEP